MAYQLNYPAVFDFDELAGIIERHGLPARVEQTGGGVATLYVGEYDADGRALAIAGPGWFEGPYWTEPRATFDEFSWGPDDDGESEHTMETAPRDLEELAADIVEFARDIEAQR